MTKRFMAQRPPKLALGSIAAVGLVLSACGDQTPEDVLFTSADQCTASGVDADICNAEYQAALQSHLRDAPRFDGQAACEAEYGEGRCLESQDGSGQGGGSSFFLPFMTGYVVSSAVRGLTGFGAYNDYRRNASYTPTPIYSNRSGTTYTSNRTAVGQPAQPRPYNVNTRTVARQGFGGSASGRGFSFGG